MNTERRGLRDRNTQAGDPTRPIVRCAIYTRKSTDENTDNDFNSLDAQREAGEMYVRSQASEGWIVLPERYDDLAFSGATLERPALKRLLRDIEAGGIDVVLTYKIDRFSRSLLDFTRLIETLEANGTSLVAVTPAGSAPVRLTPTTSGVRKYTGWPSMAASASMPPTPQPTTPSPLIMVV